MTRQSDSASSQLRSAGIVVVHGQNTPYRYLLLRAYGYWDFPKGRNEPNEPLIETARRETREETGLIDLEFRWGNCFVETPPYGGGKIARYYIAASRHREITLGIHPTLARAEHHEYRWVRYAEGCQLVGGRIRAVLEWAHDVIDDRA